MLAREEFSVGSDFPFLEEAALVGLVQGSTQMNTDERR
jgi:hypothetical protein